MVLYVGMVWYGIMVWYGMVWYGQLTLAAQGTADRANTSELRVMILLN